MAELVPMTARQRTYLRAFDTHLRSRTDAQRSLSRARMDAALGPVLDEAGIGPRPRHQRDLIETLIAAWVRRRA